MTGSQGHRFTCTRPFDLYRELLDFACEARPVRGTAFLTWQGRFRLTSGKFNKLLKRVALAVGLDPQVISTHSLRIAGASALANRGFPDHVIQSVGRYKSLAFPAYIRLVA